MTDEINYGLLHSLTSYRPSAHRNSGTPVMHLMLVGVAVISLTPLVTWSLCLHPITRAWSHHCHGDGHCKGMFTAGDNAA